MPRPISFSSRRRSGIVLVMISGLLALLLLLSVALLGLAGGAAAGAGAVRSGAQADLAAASGIHYAAARLEERVDVPALSASTRGDDWTCRDARTAPLERMSNPSYSHGEAWTEAGVADGAFSAGETSGSDLDGGGRFSAWSGRLRGGSAGGSIGDRFALRISCEEGGIPLNAGALWAADLGGSANYDWNTIPDHKDPNILYHAGLVRMLNNLGVILRPSPWQQWTRRRDYPGFQRETLYRSNLGDDLMASRPVGGYRSWSAVVAALRGWGYRKDEIELFRPFIDLGPYPRTGEIGRNVPNDSVSLALHYVPISLQGAPSEVLQAAWMYLRGPGPGPGLEQSVQAIPWSWDFVSEGAAAIRDDRIGLFYSSNVTPSISDSGSAPVLWPDESIALAQETIALRREGGLTWFKLRKRFCEKAYAHGPPVASALFPVDCTKLDPVPGLQRAWLLVKANLAYQAMTIDPFPWFGKPDLLQTWATGGIDADGDPANGIQPPPTVGFWTSSSRTPVTVHHLMPTTQVRILPQGFTLAEPNRFRIDALGVLSGVGGALSAPAAFSGRLETTSERLEFTCQEDFENLTGAPGLVSRGIRAVEGYDGAAAIDPAVRMDVRMDGDMHPFPHVASLPRWQWRGQTTDAAAAAPGAPTYGGFSRMAGALALGPDNAGIGTAQLYWPIQIDFDGAPQLAPEEGREFWTEHDPSWALSAGMPQPPFRLGIRASFTGQDYSGVETSKIKWDNTAPPHNGVFRGASTPHGVMGEAINGDFPGQWVTIQCPGFESPPGTPPESQHVEKATIEGWMGTDSAILVRKSDEMLSNERIQILSRWAFDPSDPARSRRGILFNLYVGWLSSGMFYSKNQDWFLPQPAAPGDQPTTSHHVVCTMERMGDGTLAAPKWTQLKLYMDGSSEGRDPATGAVVSMTLDFKDPARTGPDQGTLSIGPAEKVHLLNVDEVKLYSELVTPVAGVPNARYEPMPDGRYVRRGTFTSPLYVVDAPFSLKRTQWNALIPACMQGDPVQVDVRGYWDEEGKAPASLLWTWIPGGAEVAVDLAGAGIPEGIRSFRYRVRFDCGGVDPFRESPLFESIWFSFRRHGRKAAWGSWELR